MTQDEKPKNKFSFQIEYTERQLSEPTPLAPWPYVTKKQYKDTVRRKNTLIWLFACAIILKCLSATITNNENVTMIVVQSVTAGCALFTAIANQFLGKLED